MRDSLSQERYDLTFDQFSTETERESVYETGKTKGYYGFGEMPESRFFDLIQKVQPNSKRWTTDYLRETPGSFDEFFMGRPHESLL